MNDPYSRVYHSVMDDPKFDGIREDCRTFGAWVLLLIVADMSWPATSFVPPTVPRACVARLQAVHLIDLYPGRRYRVHGLDAEREKRSHSARNAAAVRWHGSGNAETMPRRDEYETSTPLPPTSGGSRSNGTNPRAVAAALTRKAEEAERDRKARRQKRYLAYARGQITEAQRMDMDERDADLAELAVTT